MSGKEPLRPVSLFRPTVLIVDDDQGVRAALTLDLEDHVDVVGVPDGPSALAVLRLQAVAVVLLDLLLPGPGGLDVLREIKAIDATLPVIVVSAVNHPATIVEGMRLGAVNYLTKPWSERELVAAVVEAIARRHGRGRGVLLVTDDVESLAPLHVVLIGQVPVQVLPVAAARRADRHGAALVVLDGDAAGARAVEVLRALRQRHGSTALVLTTNPAELQAAPGLDAEVCARPYRLADVLHRIGLLLPVRHGQAPYGQRLSDHASRAADYIARRYRATIALRDVAEYVGLSTDRLAHVFRRDLGMPMKEYAMRLRVAVGCRLLGESERKLEDIAQWLGFDHASHFSRAFVGVMGERPGAYRRRVCTLDAGPVALPETGGLDARVRPVDAGAFP